MKTSYTLLLLQPPVRDFYDTPIRLQPLGLAYLKAQVEQRLPEFRVIVKDYHQGWGRRAIPLPNELAYLKAYYAHPDKSPFSSFYHFYHFGASFEAIAADVAAAQPDVVGISALFSPYYRETLRCAEAIKERLNAPIIVGGAHVSAAPESVLRHACVDFVIRGEGERPLVEFLKAWTSGGRYEDAPNLGLKRDGAMIFTPLAPNDPLDELPPPDFSDFPPERYALEGRPLCMIAASRSCPHQCAFCSTHLTFGATYRRRSNEAILQEIAARYAQGYRVFDFEDDNLTVDRDAMLRLCEGLIARFPARDAQFLAMNGLSHQSLDAELLGLMKRAGFTHLNLSLVSADADTRRKANRPHSLDHYRDVVGAGAALGFKIVSYQIFGLPDEPLDAMLDTLIVNIELPALLGASPLYLSPNTPMARAFPPMTEADFVTARLTAFAVETAHVTRGDLFTLFIITRMLNFLKGLAFPADSIAFEDALAVAEQRGGRAALGAELLRRLFAERILHAATGRGFEPIRHFRADLFFRLWSRLRFICTQEGKTILLKACP